MSEMMILSYGQGDTISVSELLSSTHKVDGLIPVRKGNKIIFTSLDQQWFWTEEWQAGERKVDEYIQKGEIETFSTMEEFLNTLKE